MVKLAGQQLQDFQNWYQTKNAQTNTTAAQGGGGNFITDLISGITSPFTGAVKAVVNPLLTAGQMVVARAQSPEAFSQLALHPENLQTVGPNQEWQNMMANPMSTGLQKSAGLASYLIPGGAGLGGAIISGALMGGLGGFSNADLGNAGEALKSIGLGAGIGALTGGVTQKLLGKFGQKVTSEVPKSQVGTNLRAKNLTLDITKFNAPAEAKAVGRQIINYLDDRGLPTATKEIAANSINTAQKIGKQELNQFLTTSSAKVNAEKIANNIIDHFGSKYRMDVMKNPEISSFVNRLIDLGPNADAAAVNALKFEAQDQLAPLFSRLAKDNPKMSAIEEGLKVIRDQTDTALKTNTELASYRPLMEELSAYNKVKPMAIKGASTGTSISAPMLTGGTKIPIGGITDRILNTTGKLIENIPRTGSGATNLLTTLLGSKVGSKLPAILGGTATQQHETMPVTTTGTSDLLGTNNLSGTSGTDSLDSLLGTGGATTQQSQVTPQQLFLGLYSAGMKPAEAITLANFLVPAKTGGKVVPSAQLLTLSDIKQSVGMLGDLDKMFQETKGAFDPILGGLRQLNPYDNEVRKVNALNMVVKQIIGKGLEGGVLRKEDEEKYKQILPQITDTPEVVQYKIDTLKTLLGKRYTSYVSDLAQGGYDVNAGGTGDSSIADQNLLNQYLQ
jgi:hypothetical protein